ncbi:amino acid ABC transporter permease [Pseudomonas sp. NPDC089422]|uniref:amino acid ABC transporter permease n=1 Tax=Pseudomonas sp. NPDC089422 TaxID=3364466 RepID=UPI00380BEB6E
MTDWQIIWEVRDVFLHGVWTTVLLFAASFTGAFLLGCLAHFGLSSNALVRSGVRGYISIMRMLPFLILAYLFYYGAPQLGFRPNAWVAGAAALSLYHGAYLAEILRGSKLTLPVGQAEAALAQGFRRVPLYLRIILPQLLMRSRPLIGNQMVYALKDTAFLSIITLQELTAAASAVQASYFIPTNAFLVSIAFYVLLTLLIDLYVQRLARYGVARGIEHA